MEGETLGNHPAPSAGSTNTTAISIITPACAAIMDSSQEGAPSLEGGGKGQLGIYTKHSGVQAGWLYLEQSGGAVTCGPLSVAASRAGRSPFR